VFAKHVGRSLPGEGLCPAHAAPDLGELPPVWTGLVGGGPKAALARDPPVGVGDGAVFLAPTRRRQHDMREGRRVGRPAVGNHDEGAGGQCGAHPIGARQTRRRVGGDDPQRLDPPVQHGIEKLDGLEARLRSQCRRPPECLQGRSVCRIVEVHVGGELIGEAADFPAAHRVGLTGDGERSGTGPADPSGGKVAVDDCVDLVGSGRGLVHALGINRHHPVGCGEHVEERFQDFGIDPAFGGDGVQFRGHVGGSVQVRSRGQRCRQTRSVPIDPGVVDLSGPMQIQQ
jgi:hypothetical protein